MDLDTYHSYMAAQRAKAEAIRERADAKLARLGGETASQSSGDLRTFLRAGLTAEEMERDAKSMRNILRVWKKIGYRGGDIQLPSGKLLRKSQWADGDDQPQRELAVIRPHKYRKGRR